MLAELFYGAMHSGPAHQAANLALIVGLVLVVGGILLATVRGRRRQPPEPPRTIDETAGDPA